jgi:hypothetical protein
MLLRLRGYSVAGGFSVAGFRSASAAFLVQYLSCCAFTLSGFFFAHFRLYALRAAAAFSFIFASLLHFLCGLIVCKLLALIIAQIKGKVKEKPAFTGCFPKIAALAKSIFYHTPPVGGCACFSV